MAKSSNIFKEITQNLTTPQIIKRGIYCCWGSSLVLLISTLSVIGQQRAAIRTLSKDSAPNIVDAIRLKDALAGMNAFAANELLTKLGENLAAIQGYQERYERLTDRLVSVAENITYGDKERQPIRTLQKGVGDYIAKLQQARDFNAQGNNNAKIIAFREASTLMDDTLLPAANTLGKVNLDALDDSYQKVKIKQLFSVFAITILGLFLLGILIGLQIFLRQRTRRTFNLGLLGATLVTGCFLLYTLQILISSSQALKIAKEDAFDSIYSLRKIRSLVYAAVADENRYLLDSALANQHEKAFFEKIHEIANLPINQFPVVAKAVKEEQSFPNFTGLLAQEIKNITFPGERENVVESLVKMGDYLKIDERIRQLEKEKKHQEAVALINSEISKFHQRLKQIAAHTQDTPVCSNAADSNNSDCFLTQLMEANLQTYSVNKKAFYQGIDAAFKIIGGYEVIMPRDIDKSGEIQPQNIDQFAIIASSATVAICLFSLFGVLPRLKEYDF